MGSRQSTQQTVNQAQHSTKTATPFAPAAAGLTSVIHGLTEWMNSPAGFRVVEVAALDRGIHLLQKGSCSLSVALLDFLAHLPELGVAGAWCALGLAEAVREGQKKKEPSSRNSLPLPHGNCTF